jgi:hypothetical protein
VFEFSVSIPPPLIIIFYLAGPGFELKCLTLLGKCSTIWATTPALFAFIFQTWFLYLLLGLALDPDSPTSDTCIAEMRGGSHSNQPNYCLIQRKGQGTVRVRTTSWQLRQDMTHGDSYKRNKLHEWEILNFWGNRIGTLKICWVRHDFRCFLLIKSCNSYGQSPSGGNSTWLSSYTSKWRLIWEVTS